MTASGTRVALLQSAPHLGQVDDNVRVAGGLVADVARSGAGLAVLPELALCGYDLGAIPDSAEMDAGDPRLTGLGAHGVDVVVGFRERAAGRRFNSAAYLSGGRALHIHRKLFLPTYGTWEERKHSIPGSAVRAFDTSWGRVALLVCADAWQPVLPWLAVQDGAEVLVVLANSADSVSFDLRICWQEMVRTYARLTQSFVLFVNRAGEENGIRFWGGSCVVDPGGAMLAQAGEEAAVVSAEIDLRCLREARRRLPLMAEARLAAVGREVERLVLEGGDR
jgi:N-carbamoylputrescine amidase